MILEVSTQWILLLKVLGFWLAYYYIMIGLAHLQDWVIEKYRKHKYYSKD